MNGSLSTREAPAPLQISPRAELTNRRQPSRALASGRGRAKRDVRWQVRRAIGRGAHLTLLSMGGGSPRFSGRRFAAFHEGDRSEYLATFVLSSFAAVSPVPRQEYYGLDLICSLTRREEDGSLYVEQGFGV